MKSFAEFLLWEQSTKDTIDFKRIYADMAGDTLAGLVLSQIVFWHIPNKQGKSKLRIEKEGKKWMACNRAEWWDSTRLTPRQIDRVLQILENKHLIEKKLFKFAGSPTVHIRINEDVFLMSHNSYLANPLPNPYASEKQLASDDSVFTNPLNGNSANGEMEIDESVKSITETTTKTTTEKDIADYAALPMPTGKVVKEKKTNPYYDAIKELWDLHGGHNRDMQNMLLGISKKKGYAENNISPAMELEEFVEWVKWAKHTLGQYMVKAPAKVNGSITKWREMDSPKITATKPSTPQAPSANDTTILSLLESI